MRKLFLSLIAVAGFLGFASIAQAGCGGHMDMATTTDSTTVATDSTKPVLQEQSGG